MDVKYAILGFLSWQPFTGYDLKKAISDSPAFYWSGNNNQIYTTLVKIHKEGLVTNEVQHQERYPSRKVYTITNKGLSELRIWLASSPETPQLRKSFLVQFAWADLLSPTELDELLEQYEYKVKMQLLMYQEQKRRGSTIGPARTPRETYLWNMIFENHISSFKAELAWVGRVRRELSES
ncbi:PadR family transcriptional regulator [Chloroflexota bacterium]